MVRVETLGIPLFRTDGTRRPSLELLCVDRRPPSRCASGIHVCRVPANSRRPANTDRLRAIIAEHGWPGRALVGDDGAEAAWLIAQHADHQLDFQREALALLERAVHDGDAPASRLPHRSRTHERRTTTAFGTQVADITNSVASPWPIVAEEHVDQRRANAGLEAAHELPQQLHKRLTVSRTLRKPAVCAASSRAKGLDSRRRAQLLNSTRCCSCISAYSHHVPKRRRFSSPRIREM
jgi:hypothetical protein